MENNNLTVRIDKYLWAVRLFKTRSLASEACKKGKILINNVSVKSSRLIKKDIKFDIKEPPIIKSYLVIEILGKRVGAKLVPSYLKNVTAKDELIKLEIIKNSNSGTRDRGTGRPTKRDRRDINKFSE